MKNSELKRLVEEYRILKAKKHHTDKTVQKMQEIEQRYRHETGEPLEHGL